jgi:DNA polymerase V
VEGDFTVKYLGKRGDSVVLKPANARYKEIEFKDGQELQIWGVVTSTVKKFR